MDTNLQIVQRLLELSRNELSYSIFPQPYDKEYIFLANVINDSRKILDHEFAEAFQQAVGQYKSSLAKNKKYGWFNKPERLIWINMQKNQLNYAVYGERHVRELKFNADLGNMAYKNLIEQIDCTVLMSAKQKKEHLKKCDAMLLEIIKEIETEDNQLAK